MYFDSGWITYLDARTGDIHECILPSLNKNNTTNCTFVTTDGAAHMILALTFNNDTTDEATVLEGVAFDRGTAFRTIMGRLFDPKWPCGRSQTADSELIDYVGKSTVCCSKFELLSISDNRITETCAEFTSLSTFSPFPGNISAVLSTEYKLYPNQCIDIRAVSFTAPKSLDYYLQPNENAVTCSSTATSCSQQLRAYADFQFQFSVYVTDFKDIMVNGIAGQLVMRNGQVYHDGDKPFTSTDKCWKQVMKDPTGNTYFTSNFCCKKFITTSRLTCTQYQITISAAGKNRLSLYARMSLQENLIVINVHKYYIHGGLPAVIQAATSGYSIKLCTFKSDEEGALCTLKLETGSTYDLSFIFGTAAHQTSVQVFTLAETTPLNWTVKDAEKSCSHRPNGTTNSHHHGHIQTERLNLNPGNVSDIVSHSTCCLSSHHFT
uniref:CUB domain-containing protein n=1 Tax=Panagrellus redivivus TaxID=6233 RepID=A0A7E4V9D9_PANRE